MTLFRRSFLAACACAGACALPAGAGEVRLPPISGQLKGEVTPLKIAGVPRLHWTVDVRPAENGGGGRVVDALFEGPGTRLHVLGNFTSTEDGAWRILEGEIKLATWFPVAAGVVGDALQGLTASGTVRVFGEGTVQAGEPRGTLSIVLEDGRIESRDGWALGAVAFAGKFSLAMPEVRARSVEPFELKVGAISTYRFGARNLSLHGTLNEDRSIQLGETTVEIAGGQVKLDPNTIQLSPLFVSSTLRIVNVGLQDIAALVPYGLSESHGRIDGAVQIGWKDPDGLLLGAGELKLNMSEPASVRLVSKPGFFTAKLPPRFGPFANPAYPDLVEIELGRAPLQLETLTVRLTPEGDEHGHTATVHLTGHPVKAKAGVKKVDFDVNVSGPLADVINLGLKQKEKISFEAR